VTFAVFIPNKQYAYMPHLSKPSQLHVYVVVQSDNRTYLSRQEFNVLKLVETIRGVPISHLNLMIGDFFA
jgi:hypothetical protein